jgi:hypothetical protein
MTIISNLHAYYIKKKKNTEFYNDDGEDESALRVRCQIKLKKTLAKLNNNIIINIRI